MEQIFLDLTKETKKSVIRQTAREQVLADIAEYLGNRYDRFERTGPTEYTVVVGMAKDDEGFTQDVCVTIGCKSRNWYAKDCAKANVKRYDLDEAVEDYELERKLKKSPKK